MERQHTTHTHDVYLPRDPHVCRNESNPFRRLEIQLERVEVAVVHPDDARADVESNPHFLVSVHLLFYFILF